MHELLLLILDALDLTTEPHAELSHLATPRIPDLEHGFLEGAHHVRSGLHGFELLREELFFWEWAWRHGEASCAAPHATTARNSPRPSASRRCQKHLLRHVHPKASVSTSHIVKAAVEPCGNVEREILDAVGGRDVSGLTTAAGRVLADPWFYRIWQAPFARQKFEPVLRHTRLRPGLRVLDVGCGPGTNARYFGDCDYTGIDLNARYIEHARRHWPGRFLVGDVCELERHTSADLQFELIVMNSLLHHLELESVHRLLAAIERLLATDGTVEILDLVMPERTGVARWLANRDRGAFARPEPDWSTIFRAHFEPCLEKRFDLSRAGVVLWQMIYFKGLRRSS